MKNSREPAEVVAQVTWEMAATAGITSHRTLVIRTAFHQSERTQAVVEGVALARELPVRAMAAMEWMELFAFSI